MDKDIKKTLSELLSFLSKEAVIKTLEQIEMNEVDVLTKYKFLKKYLSSDAILKVDATIDSKDPRPVILEGGSMILNIEEVLFIKSRKTKARSLNGKLSSISTE